jgi:prefoldin alpha subunit
MATATAQQKIKLDQFQLEDLVQLKQRLTQDLQTFLGSYNGLKALEQKFEYGKVLIEQISTKSQVGDEVMIPLTNSLFVPGKLKDTDKFLIELGTGYFAEYTAQGASDFCSRKSAFTKDTSEQAQNEMENKRKFIEEVNIEISKKVQVRQE